MQDQLKTKYVLVDYTAKHAQEAFGLITRWVQKQGGGDVAGAFNSTTKLHNFCKLVMKDNKVYAVIFPDYATFNFPHYIKVHAVLSEEACACKDNQVFKFKEYLHIMFGKGLHKAAIEYPSISRLTRRIIEALGFKPEGIKRKEWILPKSYCDIYMYGMLKTEWEDLYGRQ